MKMNDVGDSIPPSPEPQPNSDSQPAVLSGKAVASLVLGIFGCLFFPAILGLILGILAYREIGRNPGRLRGQGLAVSGIILSALAVFVCVPMMAAILFPVFAKARAKANQITCLSNLKCVSLSLRSYSMDYDGYYPPASRWNEAVLSEHAKKSNLICPAADRNDVPSYALSSDLAGKIADKVTLPATTVLVFDSFPGANQAGGPALLCNPGRHSDGNTIVFADGHARWVSREDLTLKWTFARNGRPPLPPK